MSKKDMYATIAGFVLKSGKIDNKELEKILYRGLRDELANVGTEFLRIFKQAVCDEMVSRKEGAV